MNSYQLGDTVTLSTTFKVAGVLTDPGTVSLVLEAPDGTQSTYTYAAAQIIRDSVGAYHKQVAGSTVGVWSYQWTGTGAAPGVQQGQFTVADLLVAHGSDLTTIGRVRDWLGITDTTQDSRLQQLITAASKAVMEYAQREFAPVTTSATRTFALKRDGLITFGNGDLQSVSQVQIDTEAGGSPTTLTSDQYQLWPIDAPHGVYRGIRFYTFAVGPVLRQWFGLYRHFSVTGAWGFPSVPADVEQATLITVAKWFKRDETAWSNELPYPNTSTGNELPLDAIRLIQSYRRFV